MPQARTEDRATIEELTRQIRHDIVTATTKAGSGHPSTSLSMVEIVTTLYFGGVLRYDPS